MPEFNYLTILTLGPAGTFSDEAAKKISSPASIITYTHTFAEALFMLSRVPQSVAVVPIENSVAGIVDQVQDLLVGGNLNVVAEIKLPVRYALLVHGCLKEVTTHFAHPQAIEQTSNFAARHFPQSNVVFSNSNVDSGVRFFESVHKNQSVAAIVPGSFAEKYPEFLFEKDIQDYKSNTTRFLVVETGNDESKFDYSRQKTSLFIEFKEDRAGLLYELLSIFNRFNINLCRLESRPSKETPWFYVFYVDFTNNQYSQQCLEELQNSPFKCKILGSYSLIA